MESGSGSLAGIYSQIEVCKMVVKGERSIRDVGRWLVLLFFSPPLLKSTDIPPDWYL